MIVSFVTASCSESNKRYASFYEHYGFEEPEHIGVDKNVINLYPQDFDYFINVETSDSVLGNGKFLEIINDSMLVVVIQNKLLKKINLNSLSIVEEITFTGNGPGEYNYIDNILKMDSSLFIFDKGMHKLIEYDLNFNHIKDLKLPDVETLNQRSTAALSSKFFYYPIHLDEEYLFSRIELNKDSSLNFHKRFIPTGKQPIIYNSFIQSINSDDELLLASSKMPLFFIYDRSLKLKNLYELDSPNIDKAETTRDDESSNRIINPPPKIIDTKKTISITGFSVIDAIMTENRIFIYFSNRFINDRYLIVLNRNGDEWMHSGNYRFLKSKDDLFTIFDMSYSFPWLYLSSQFEEGIIRIDTRGL